MKSPVLVSTGLYSFTSNNFAAKLTKTSKFNKIMNVNLKGLQAYSWIT